MYAAATDEGICMLEFTDRKMLETELKHLSKSLNANIIQGENPHFKILEEQLTEYFEGKEKNFPFRFFVGSDFQKSVWEVLMKIPFGETWSYAKQSEILGDSKSESSGKCQWNE